MRRMKYKYFVEMAYVDTNTDRIKLEYVEALAYNAIEAMHDAVSYMEKFPDIGNTTVLSINRQ